jgi:hypothetical protein
MIIRTRQFVLFVMAGLDPAIRETLHMDPRVKPGDDDFLFAVLCL